MNAHALTPSLETMNAEQALLDFRREHMSTLLANGWGTMPLPIWLDLAITIVTGGQLMHVDRERMILARHGGQVMLQKADQQYCFSSVPVKFALPDGQKAPPGPCVCENESRLAA
ncbi:MAG: hypothetical protein HQM03_10880 [Magnetococcales bacterium]|nr:hypothetical protein [Magnetococcales bacterium]